MPTERWENCKVQIRKDFLPPEDKLAVGAPREDDPAAAWANLKFEQGEDFDDFSLRLHAFLCLFPTFLDVFDTDALEQMLQKFPVLAVRAYRKRNGPGPYGGTNLFQMLRDMRDVLTELNFIGAGAAKAGKAGAAKAAGRGAVRPASHAAR